MWAYFFASQGVAVLTYDKRGVRDSGGVYSASGSTANLQLLAADALAGVSWLRRQPQIDSTRIGLTGGSQAGWVIEMAAARSPAVTFLALQASPAMSVGRQHAYDHITREGQLTPPPSDSQIQTELAQVPDSGYNPAADIASLQIPVLWQLGAVDKRMYTPETVADLQQITASGSHSFTVHVYPGGAHSLRLTTNGLISQERSSPGFCPGVFQDLAAWLKTTVLKSSG
jgi:dienelactone hydrolase